jgi:FkbM family methyltransferase
MGLIGRAVKNVARRAGLDVRRHDPWSAPAARRTRLLASNDFALVLDVGANGGQYGRELRARGYAGDIVSFEPGSNAYARLEQTAADDSRWRCLRVALGETRGTKSLNVATNEGASSSFLALTEAHGTSAPLVGYMGTETVEMVSLDELADELLPPAGHVWLKVDVQGYELHVLQGAARNLARIDSLELEVSLVELYEGQPLFDEVLRFVQEAGFRTVDVSPEFLHPATGQMLQANLIAVRPRLGAT